MDITLKFDPTQAEIDAVVHPLVAYNRTHVGDTGFQPFSLTRTDPATGAASSLVGMVDFNWLIVQFLFVPEPLRRRGNGTTLMHRAEAIARERQLVGVWLDTFGFQARPFFEKLGFTVFGTLEDHPVGDRRHFMSKRLDGAKS